MPDHPTARDLLHLLENCPPDTPVRIGPVKANGDSGQALTAELRGGALHLAVDGNGASNIYLHAVLRHRAALAELTGLEALALPTTPLAPSREGQMELLRITSAPEDTRHRTAMIMEGTPPVPEDAEPKPKELLLVLNTETAQPDDAGEAADRAAILNRISGMPARAVIAAVTRPDDWPAGLAVPCHALQWTEQRCLDCHRNFRTARGLAIHLMLEAGASELDDPQPRYWQRYMDDLRQLTEEIPQTFQKQAAYRPKP